MKEYILCAAIWYQDEELYVDQPINIESGFVISGRRHHNIINTLGQKFFFRTATERHIQGFLTSLNRFVDRKEGAEIAYNSGQTMGRKKELYSEDLY